MIRNMAMKSKSELFLYHLFWMADIMIRPTIYRVGDSFEDWAYDHGAHRQVQELQRRGFLESSPSEKGSKQVLKLTRQGVLRALGGTDPVTKWDRPWDGKWRLAMFDLPENQRTLRSSLRKELRAAKFGCLQGSVWLTPDPVENLVGKWMKKGGEQSRTLLFFTGHPCDGAGDADLVKAAWNFATIGKAYQEYREHLKQLPRTGDSLRELLLAWGNRERDLWNRCMKVDPLLPRPLWPRGYHGETAWTERLRTLKSAGTIASQI